MAVNIRFVGTYHPRICGIGTFTRDSVTSLLDYTGEVSSVSVSAIDKNGEQYFSPVDIVFDQLNEESWMLGGLDSVKRAKEKPDPTVVILEHEFGLDEDGTGNNYVELAKLYKENGIMTLVWLHTIPSQPTEYQERTLRELSEYCDMMIAPTKSGIDRLNEVYGIHYKLGQIDHGVREQDKSRLEAKKILELEDMIVLLTPGLRSLDKGLQFSIPAYGKYLREHCSEKDRENIVYLIVGQVHPEFILADGGRYYKDYQEIIKKAIEIGEVRYTEIKDKKHLKIAARENDVVVVDAYQSVKDLMGYYAGSDMIPLPYLNMEQMLSGILADAIGSGRVPLSTPFDYAKELLNPENKRGEGPIIDTRHGRGILIDPGEPFIDQMPKAVNYLISNPIEHRAMEWRAQKRGHKMKWNNTAWQILKIIKNIEKEKNN
ncbi:hypothetical protein CEE44_00875 [Candidatus Woesearchaeota archaeon B3_Woes]|nr:MAG: hypothetical protein CEE44_00875 [Candidatus Woesearchaeota archaeon B3_Woes]